MDMPEGRKQVLGPSAEEVAKFFNDLTKHAPQMYQEHALELTKIWLDQQMMAAREQAETNDQPSNPYDPYRKSTRLY